MGFIKQMAGKITGADIQADAVTRSSEAQSEATRKASEQAAESARVTAEQTARMQTDAAARTAAQGNAADANSKPLESSDVLLEEPKTESAAAGLRKRRQQFGVGGGSSGVNI